MTTEGGANAGTPYEVMPLADRPDLAPKWAEIHWREWGDEPGREELSWWVNSAQQYQGRTEIPIAFIAVDDRDDVLGGMGVEQFDLEERRDRSPWVVGVIVRPDHRSRGIGQAVMAHLSAWAVEVGIPQLWVATGGRAIQFYQQCGFEVVETVAKQDGDEATVLTKNLLPASQE